MKSLFILAGVVMMMLTGCGSESGSYNADTADNGVVADQPAGTPETVVSTINEPVVNVSGLPAVPTFPANQ